MTTGPAWTTRSPGTDRRTARTCRAAAWACGWPGSCATTSTSPAMRSGRMSASRSAAPEPDRRAPALSRRGRRSPEEVAEEGLLLPPRVGPGGVRGLLGALHLAQDLTHHRTQPRTGCLRPVCGLLMGRLLVGGLLVGRLLGLRGRGAAVPGVLRVDQPVQLTAIEEDAAA